MKNNNTIKIKNELPELLEAVCNHKDCAEWLKDAIWDAFNNREQYVTFTAIYWRSRFESMTKTIDTVSDVLDAEVLR